MIRMPSRLFLNFVVHEARRRRGWCPLHFVPGNEGSPEQAARAKKSAPSPLLCYPAPVPHGKRGRVREWRWNGSRPPSVTMEPAVASDEGPLRPRTRRKRGPAFPGPEGA